MFLDSGFTPQNSPVLREKLNAVIKKTIDNYVLRYRLDVPKSCSAFIVPGQSLVTPRVHSRLIGIHADPYGVLGPDEIQIKSSRRDFKTPDGLDADVITGDVLVRIYTSSQNLPFLSNNTPRSPETPANFPQTCER